MAYQELQHEWHELIRTPPDPLPPAPGDPGWHEWAERQTVLKLRAELDARKASAAPPPPPPDLRVMRRPQTVRVHLANLKLVKG